MMYWFRGNTHHAPGYLAGNCPCQLVITVRGHVSFTCSNHVHSRILFYGGYIINGTCGETGVQGQKPRSNGQMYWEFGFKN